ncbi:MAG: hypothetical protein ACYCPS_02625 [Candidatus Saccharimonadales bacterium]
MDNSFWFKQSTDKPLYENLLWSRPENRALAGRLLIIGGNSQGFGLPSIAYAAASKAGVGNIDILLPDSLRSSLSGHLDNAVFIDSNPSGGFARSSLAEILEYCSQSDLTMLAGDFGHNSETYVLLESLIQKYNGPMSLTDDAIDAFLTSPNLLMDRDNTLIVADIPKLQKLLLRFRVKHSVTSSMDLLQIVNAIQGLSLNTGLAYITWHQNYLVVSVAGKVSTTKYDLKTNWQSEILACSSVWWLQNQSQPFEAMTTAIYEAAK